MQRIGFQLKVKQDKLDEYKAAHREVWPEMLQALRETGWHNYSLFMAPDGTLFGYVETPDFQRALAEMAKRDVNTKWQTTMAPLFESLTGKPDENMQPLELVFHLD